MAEIDEDAAKLLVSDIAHKIASRKSCPNKDFLINLLKQAAHALPKLKRSPLLNAVVKPLSDSLVKHSLLKHKDKDVKLLVAICFSEIIRILAPTPDFSDEDLRDIFKLFISMFSELADISSPYFRRRVLLLETVAELNFCVLMLDTDSDDLIIDMFSVFFNAVREENINSVLKAMSSIMALILKEKLSEKLSRSLLEVTLQYLLKEAKDASPSSQLAVAVIKNCSEELEPSVCGFLTSCILDKNAVGNELREYYHEIIFELFRCAPQMLIAVIPNLTQELLTDQVDVRIKAINLIGRLFALPGSHVAHEYRHVFQEFLNRFSDKSAEVRVCVLSCAKAFYMTHPSTKESDEVLAALEGRLLDFEDKVRAQAVTVVSDLAKSNRKSFPPNLISQAAKRFRDKKVSVRRKTLQKLLPVYHDYCVNCSEELMSLNDHFEAIPCGMLMLYYDKDCKGFGPLNMESMLADDLFPASLSVEERTRHWIFILSLHTIFTASHAKALQSILSQKQRLQTDMRLYLELRKNGKEIGSDETEKRKRKYLMKMSKFFPDPTSAEDCFDRLDKVKDNTLFNRLEKLLDEVTIECGQVLVDNLLREFGDQHLNSEFLQLLLKKCLFNIFSSEHVCCILKQLSCERFGDHHLMNSSLKLLLIIVSYFPLLIRGSEEQFCCLLLQEDIPLNEEVIQVINKAAPHISYKLRDIIPSLERICLEGTRTESKLAVSAIAAIVNSSEPSIFSKLYKKVVDALQDGQNVPTVLQSLGCISQFSALSFETYDQEIIQCIFDKIFHVDTLGDLGSFENSSDDISLCRLKIFGLKALVRSCLSRQRTQTSRYITRLLHEILQMLQKDCSDVTNSCEAAKYNIRLAAAISVLRLSRRWDLYISPTIFCCTVSMAKDPSSFVRRKFVDKTFKFLKEHRVPCRYACAFALAASDSDEDLQKDLLKYMAEVLRIYNAGAHLRQNSASQGEITDYPVYIVVFLIHVLAHDKLFPEDCENKEVFAQFCSPLVFTLQALVNARVVDGDVNLVNIVVSNLRSIFNAIKRAEDAVDAQATPKLHMLADFGLCFIKTLDNIGPPNSHSPNHVMLPSSLYKHRVDGKRKDLSIGCGRNISNALHDSVTDISCPVRTIDKVCMNQEYPSGSDAIKGNSPNLDMSHKVDMPTYGLKGQDEIRTEHGGKNHGTVKQKLSTYEREHSGIFESSGFHNEFSLDDELDEGELGNSKPIIRNKQLSSCDSVATKPLMAHKEDRPNSNSLRKLESITKCSNVIVEPSKILRSKQKDTDLCSSKGASDNGEVDVVRLDNDVTSHHSSSEMDSSSLQSLNCDPAEQSSIIPTWKMVDTHSTDASQLIQKVPEKENKYLLNRKLPTAVMRNKVQQASVNSSVSEVVNQDAIARRTRRRKV